MSRDKERLRVRRGVSLEQGEAAAVSELHRAVYQPDAALTVFHCSPKYDRERLAAALRESFGGQLVVGCTSAGEIGPTGYVSGGITGVSIASEEMSVISRRLDQLSTVQMRDGQELSLSMLRSLDPAGKGRAAGNLFGFLLVDGMCCKEELVVASLYRGLGDVPLFGGSAADGTSFGTTYVYHDGEFHTNSGVFTLVKTTLPFLVFKTEHFVGSERKLVVTHADPERRRVIELDGESAARAYARAIGLTVAELTPEVFASYPVVVRLGNAYYVRSLQKMNEDESLTFFCAIDEGIVLTVGRGVDIQQNLREAFQDVERNIGKPKVVLGCDCILRGLELDQRALRGPVGQVMAENQVCGFGTYGEQYNAMHVNQTFTGVAIAEPATAAE
jgi:hypothetical protein